jgi:hypothetical protein
MKQAKSREMIALLFSPISDGPSKEKLRWILQSHGRTDIDE